jgi:hypothetical protein
MPLYSFKCDSCLGETDRFTRNPPFCNRCDLPMRRVWGFHLAHSMPEHFNPTVGKVVTNERAFKDELKRMGEKESEVTGLYHDYQPIDISDPKACGVTDEGLDATRRQARDSGSVGPEKGRKVIV